MVWTKEEYVRNWPDSPQGVGGQLVDEGAVLRAIQAHERLMRDCRCDGDIGGRIPVAGCPVHRAEDGEGC